MALGQTAWDEPGFPDAVAPNMPLASGVVGGTRSARDVVSEALGLLGVVAPGDETLADEEDVALRALNGLLRSGQLAGANLWRISDLALDVAAGTPEIALAGVIDVTSGRWTDTGSGSSFERPLAIWARAQYDELPNKATLGQPTCLAVVRGRANLSVRLWPIPAAAGRLQLVATRRVQDVTSLDQGLDIPGEWEDAIVWSLADRLALHWPTDPVQRGEIRAQAARMLQSAMDFDRPDSVWLSPLGGERGW